MGLGQAILAFVQLIPVLLRLYVKLKDAFGDNFDKFLADIDEQTKLVEKTIDPNMSVEEKRRLRREALLKGADAFTRIGN